MHINPQSFGQKSKNSFKNLECDINSINKNQLNSSSSKMQYSFPKSNRFAQNQASFSPPKFYDLPDVKSKRSTTLGYGNKMDLSKTNLVTPSPNNYQIKSQFQKKPREGITMSAGRDIIKTNSPFSPHAYKNPGPNFYQPKNYNLSHSYSMRPKNQDNTDKWIKSVPGPGNYSHLQLLNKQTKTFVSNFTSCPSTKFGNSTRKGLDDKPFKIPGVGSYQVSKEAMMTSKYYIRGGNRFGQGKRKGLSDQSLQTPGPGAYNKFSEFLH